MAAAASSSPDYFAYAPPLLPRLWLRRDDAEPDPEARAEMLAVLRALDAELGGREFFDGDAFGFVDIAAVPFASWFLTYERHGRFAVAEECPGLAAWATRCLRRDSVADNVYPPEKVVAAGEGARPREAWTGSARPQPFASRREKDPIIGLFSPSNQK